MAVGFPTKANWAAGDILTAAQMDDLAGTLNYLSPVGQANGSTLVANSANASGLGWAGNQAAGKNRVINGAMEIDQRNNGAAVVTNGAYVTDRYFQYFSSGTVTFQQNSTIVPDNFGYSLSATVTSAGTRTASDYFSIIQKIEGYNISDFAQGTTSAKTLTLSFWVRASITGTYGGCLRSGDNNRSYAFTYTINSANTWQYVTATIVGDSAGAKTNWPVGNTTGMWLVLGLGSGSNNQISSGSWQAQANKMEPTGTVSWAQTAGATFYVTGVQLELGSSATTFSRAGGTIQGELAACQYYCRKFATSPASGNNSPFTTAAAESTTVASSVLQFPPMRTNPSVTFGTVANDFAVYVLAALKPATAIALDQANKNAISINSTHAAASFVAGNSGTLMANGNQTANILLEAEL